MIDFTNYVHYDNPVTLAEIQQELETQQYTRAVQEAASKLQQRIDSKSEYYLNYGKSAILEMRPIAIDYTKNKYTKRNQHTNTFFWEIVKPLHEAGKKPEVVIADVVVIELTSSLSRGAALVETAGSIKKKVLKIFEVTPDEKQDKDAHAYICSLIFSIAEETEVFFLEQENQREYRLYLSPHWEAIVEEEHKMKNLTVSAYSPMVMEPKPHSSLVDGSGGYFHSSTPLLKHPFKLCRKELNEFDNPRFFEYINSVQSTPYCVNTKLLEIITDYYSNGIYFDEYPIDADYVELDKQFYKELSDNEPNRVAWAEKNGKEYKPYTSGTIARKLKEFRQPFKDTISKTTATLAEAEFYSQFSSIYYPVFLDYRGRIYPYASGKLSYQGSQLEKALLQFSNKEAVTPEGFNAILDTLGNALGYDKKIIEIKRHLAYEWFSSNLDRFVMNDWSLFFTKQKEFEEPITALALCIELTEIIKDSNYKTGIILHRDARCSGPSIMATMLGDTKVMELTGVIDYSNVGMLGDVYGSVATEGRKVAAELGYELGEECFERSVFKNPVMVGSYGGTAYGLMDYVQEQKLPREMFQVITKAMDGALPCCTLYRRSVEEAAKVQTKQLGYVHWINPITGFPVCFSDYKRKTTSLHVKTSFNEVKLTIYTPTDTVIHTKNVTTSVPNVLHNIDSTLLYMVERQVSQAGVSLSLIHDSIGTHPNHVSIVIEAYNKALGMLCYTDILNEILIQMNPEVSVPTNQAVLDGELILNSKHVLV